MAEFTFEEIRKGLQRQFIEQNPYAKAAKKAYNTDQREENPVYLALMAIAFELWLNQEAS